jgi:hypothetical protein
MDKQFCKVVRLLRALPQRQVTMACHAALFWSDGELREQEANATDPDPLVALAVAASDREVGGGSPPSAACH